MEGAWICCHKHHSPFVCGLLGLACFTVDNKSRVVVISSMIFLFELWWTSK